MDFFFFFIKEKDNHQQSIIIIHLRKIARFERRDSILSGGVSNHLMWLGLFFSGTNFLLFFQKVVK